MTTTLLDPTDHTPTGDLPQPTTPRWRPLRAGLQNIWQYDHTTRFVFHDGRLLLRGRNGVGKTKVVEVLLPFLLEGSMQPSRLDPFGSPVAPHALQPAPRRQRRPATRRSPTSGSSSAASMATAHPSSPRSGPG